jgi:hypothetical protein
MPHLVRWNEELGPFGLVVIGAHVQGGTPEEIKAKAQGLGMRFMVTEGGGVADSNAGGIPHCLVFDHEGKCVYEGFPDKAEAPMRIALGKALVAKAGKTSFSKSVQPLADALKRGASPVAALQKLLPMQKKDEDAKALIESITARGQMQLDDASARTEDDPVGVYFETQRLGSYYKGTPVGTKANELFTKLKGDKSVIVEVKARPSLDAIKKLDEALEKAAMGDDVTDPMFQKKYAAALKQMRTAHSTMTKSWPKATATVEAGEIVSRYAPAK